MRLQYINVLYIKISPKKIYKDINCGTIFHSIVTLKRVRVCQDDTRVSLLLETPSSGPKNMLCITQCLVKMLSSVLSKKDAWINSQ